MALQADSEGFLTGTPVGIDGSSYMRHLALLQEIRGDTHAIRKALTEPRMRRTAVPGHASNSPAFTPRQTRVLADSIARAARTLPSRDAKGRFVKTVAATPGGRSRSGAPLAVIAPAESAVAPGRTNHQSRQSNGRFGSNPDDLGGSRSHAGGEASKRFVEAADSIRESVSGLAQGSEQIDPTLAAAKEVGEIVSPALKLFKPLGGLFGRRGQSEEERVYKKEQVWYKRIWKELRGINQKPTATAEGGGGLMGMLSGGMGALLMPIILAALPALAVAGAGLAGTLIGKWLNDKFGQQISDMIWNTSEWVKEKWTKVGEAWTASSEWVKTKWSEATTAMSDAAATLKKWVEEKWGKVEELAGGAKTAALEAYDSTRSAGARAVDSVKSAFGYGSAENRDVLKREMNSAGIKDPREQAMFMAQMDHESQGFTRLEENLNYRSADRLMSVSATARGKGKAAVEAAIAGGPQAVAELMYGGRMGNTEAGDGYKYRGRGFAHLTGKDNYLAASNALGLDLVNNPDMAADPKVAARVATWYWKSRGLNKSGKTGDVLGATKAINGGTNGLADRQAKYEAYLAQANAGGLTVQTADQSTAVPPPGVSRAIATSIPNMRTPVPFTSAPVANAQRTPDLMRFAPGAVPSTPTPLASNANSRTPPVVVEVPLSQNLADRQIAAAATGGIGMPR